jgi:hypothetical protein
MNQNFRHIPAQNVPWLGTDGPSKSLGTPYNTNPWSIKGDMKLFGSMLWAECTAVKLVVVLFDGI